MVKMLYAADVKRVCRGRCSDIAARLRGEQMNTVEGTIRLEAPRTRDH